MNRERDLTPGEKQAIIDACPHRDDLSDCTCPCPFNTVHASKDCDCRFTTTPLADACLNGSAAS